jgi:Fe-S cluster assembly protein SufB
MTSIETQVLQPYKYGFVTDIESDNVPAGLNEDIIRLISAKKGEPAFMLEWRLKAFRHWVTMKEPTWANVKYPPIDYQAIVYYAAPRQAKSLDSLEQVDPKLIETFEKLGIPLSEQKRLSGVAVDAVFDSVSVATTFKATLAQQGIIFCPFSEAVRDHPALIEQYLGTVVPTNDNFFAALNSAVFTDGSFAYIPKGVRCPLELSTYFRINAAASGQFERTLIIADEGSYVSYLEGCSAPMRDANQLHAAVVELVALDDAQIKYSTVQNWYPGDEEGRGGIYNFVTKRGKCAGRNSKISWTQVETGSAITWKYPGCLLQGDNSIGEFYSVAVTNHRQQADTGTKMIHIGKNTRSTIVSKGISAGRGQNTYRGQVKILKGATGARNYSQCDSMLIGDQCGAHTFPYIDVRNSTAIMEHEASTSKIGEDQIFYCRQRGLSAEDATSMIVNGFCKEVFRELPMEFAVEAQRLLGISLEGSVG